MPKFSNTVLITDLDGTLLPHNKILNEKDLNAIEYFRQNGGIFTIATGRIIQAAEQFFEALKPDAPVILNNGGLIYDIGKRKTLCEHCADVAARDYTLELMERFPEMGVEINLPDGIYVANDRVGTASSEYYPFAVCRKKLGGNPEERLVQGTVLNWRRQSKGAFRLCCKNGLGQNKLCNIRRFFI